MASPPFDISIVTPGDSDIVSQFPLNERGTRDIIESWITANHDTNGDHKWVKLPYQGSTPSTPGSSIVTLYADVSGRIKLVYPDGSVAFIGVPVGSVFFFANASTPVGYLVADGSAVSRSTYADLFTLIGTTFGAGNGSTTFNLPDIKGRVIAGEDGASSRLSNTSAGFGSVPNIAATGGSQSSVLTAAQIPTITSSVSVTVTTTGSATLNVRQGGSSGVIINDAVQIAYSNLPSLGTISPSTSASGSGTGSATSNNTSGAAHSIIQPTIILRALIKV